MTRALQSPQFQDPGGGGLTVKNERINRNSLCLRLIIFLLILEGEEKMHTGDTEPLVVSTHIYILAKKFNQGQNGEQKNCPI